MDNNPFQTRQPAIERNPRLRTPQREAYGALVTFAGDAETTEREGAGYYAA